MSSEMKALALRLEGPMQSWGVDSQFNRRNTGLMPTKSAIAGMCCAALGHTRGSKGESSFLQTFAFLHMTAIAIPLQNSLNKPLPISRLQDYHTVQHTRRASGNINFDSVLTHRQFLTDAFFGVLLEGQSAILSEIAVALTDPVWGLWLGRKTCIPTAPVLAGLKDTRDEALYLLIGEHSLENFTYQADAPSFSEGRDSLPDLAVSFDSADRVFAPRRVVMHWSRFGDS